MYFSAEVCGEVYQSQYLALFSKYKCVPKSRLNIWYVELYSLLHFVCFLRAGPVCSGPF